MHWQEACLKSETKEAVRHSERYTFIRHWDGSCIYRKCYWDHNGPDKFKDCNKPDLYEGYSDWEPFK